MTTSSVPRLSDPWHSAAAARPADDPQAPSTVPERPAWSAVSSSGKPSAVWMMETRSVSGSTAGAVADAIPPSCPHFRRGLRLLKHQSADALRNALDRADGAAYAWGSGRGAEPGCCSGEKIMARQRGTVGT